MLSESLLNRTGAVAHPVPTGGSAEQAAAARYLTDLKVTHADKPVMVWQDFAYANMDYPFEDAAFEAE